MRSLLIERGRQLVWTDLEQLTSHSVCFGSSEGKSCHGNRLRKWGQITKWQIEYNRKPMHVSFVLFVHRITTYLNNVVL
jgi:hypothetical protein